MIIALYGTSCHTEKGFNALYVLYGTAPNQNYGYESHTSTLLHDSL